jgi:serine/threonine protein kinase
MKSNNNEIDSLVDETEVMRSLDHPNILKVYDVINKDKTTSIMLEYMELGSLADLVK